MKNGTLLEEIESPSIARKRCGENLKQLHPSTLRLTNPHRYPAGMELTLHERREKMISHQSSNHGSQKNQ
jgi:hypothetical protein